MYDFAAIMARLVEMQKAAVNPTLTNKELDAVDFFPYQQEAFPYMTNRMVRMAVEEVSDDIEIHRYTISMRLVVGHLTEGYTGEISADMYVWLVAILDYFDGHQLLDTDSLAAIDFVNPGDGARITEAVHGMFDNSGVGAKQHAIDFTLSLPLLTEIY